MKHLSKLLALLLIAGALVACGGDSTEIPDPEPNPSEQPDENPEENPENPDPENPDENTPLDANGNIQFPDAKFAAYMVENFDTDNDGGISPAEAAAIIKIDCRDMEIESLAGIEYCTELTSVSCGSNQLTTLNVSKNTKLRYLHCGRNTLTSLDVSKNTELRYLWCDNNQLESLDVSKNTELTSLSFGGNQLTALDVSKNTELNTLYCWNNRLTTLDISKNTKLNNLHCGNNQLTALDVSKNTELTFLICFGNQLTALDVSRTKLGNSNLDNPLQCYMVSLETLYLKIGWQLEGINKNRDEWCIHPNTRIEYKE